MAAALVLAGAVAPTARAQPVERNPPPASQSPPAVIVAPPPPNPAADDRPIGPALAAIIILGPTTSPLAGTGIKGLDLARVPRLNTPKGRAILGPFLGRLLSRKLIVEIETTIVREYRRLGYPFVEISTPQQEITGGVLQLRVLEFRLGRLAPIGAGDARYIAQGVRLKPGDPIAIRRLAEDLDWLNRYPFRTLEPVFAPGAALGESDLTVKETRTKPWRIYAGYANSGTPGTGEDRYFVGAMVGGVPSHEAVISVQVTGSSDLWMRGVRLFPEAHPAYESVAGYMSLPLAPRQSLELSADAVETNQTVEAFVVRQRTSEGRLGYRTALSNFLPLAGDGEIGLEAKRQTRSTFFGGIDFLDANAEVYQLYGAWSRDWVDRLGQSSIRVAAHVSPGGLTAASSDDLLTKFSNGRVLRARYNYVTLDFERTTVVRRGLSLSTSIKGQFAGRPIPDTEQFPLGGATLVRGYTLDDGAFDDGLVFRNTLHIPLRGFIHSRVPSNVVGPFVFADVGYGRDEALQHNRWAYSAGFGAEIHFRTNAAATVSVSHPFTDGPASRAGDWRFDARVTVLY